MKPATLCLIAMYITLAHGTAFGAIYYVKPPPAGNDANSGLAWAQAKGTVSAAIAVAAAGDEIWVAAGTYPEHIKNRVTGDGTSIDVKLYGGFRGDETRLGQRDWLKIASTLDGGGGEPPLPPETGSVITISGSAGPGMRIDGFTITRGHAHSGGGIAIVGSAPTIANNIIRDNIAGVGAGIYCANYKVTPPVAQPAFVNNAVVFNYASDGGGIAVEGTDAIVHLPAAAPVITRNLLMGNVADSLAGGIGSWGHASPFIVNNLIRGNAANYDEASGDAGGGGIYATASDLSGRPVPFAISAPTIANNLIVANGANQGAGICLMDYQRAPDPDLTPAPKLVNNTIIANNGAGVFWDNNFPFIANNQVAFNTWGLQQGLIGTSFPVIRNNNVFGNELQERQTDYQGIAVQTGASGNISADPLLANPTIGNYHLQPGSPCIDAGSAADVGQDWIDMDGQPRVIGGSVDIGADESDGTAWNVPTTIYHVSPAGADTDGLTWATARKTLQGGVDLAAATGGEVWVAAGTYAEHVRIPAYVYLYGGFAGTETSRSARDIDAHPAVIDGGGVPNVVYSAYSGYLVSALDGFTVQNGGVFTGGNPNQPLNFGVGGRGGGVVSRVSSLFLENCTIRRNSLGNPFDNANKLAYGGGFFDYLSYATVRGNSFADNELLNTADGSGAGMYLTRSMPVIDGNTFSGNQARIGSAVYGTRSNPVITRNVFSSNSFYNSYPLPVYFGAVRGAVSLDLGSGFRIEGNRFEGNRAATGAGINVQSNLAGSIGNNLIVGNVAATPDSGVNNGMGGGIYCEVPDTATENIVIANNTIVGNSAGAMPGIGELGGGIAVSLPPPLPPPPVSPPGKLVIGNNIIAFNSSGIFETPTTPMIAPTLTKNDLFNTGPNYVRVTPGAFDISADPLFVNRAAGDYRLQAGSPCVDAGDNALVPAGAHDYAGNARVVDGKHTGTAVVDIGAYELMTGETLRVNITGTGTGTVTISPGGIACSASCSVQLTSGTTLTLQAVPAEYSQFSGWSGAGCSGTADCVLSLVTDTAVEAGFALDSAHSVLGGNGGYYSSLQGAYDGALQNDVIKAWGIEFREHLTLHQAKSVSLWGGYDAGYGAVTGVTVLNGILEVRLGRVEVTNLVIR